jgi:integrase
MTARAVGVLSDRLGEQRDNMAQRRKLTETTIAQAVVPSGRRQLFLWDSQITGFGVRILSGGSKIFWLQYRPSGGRSVSARMIRIGPWPSISVADARKAAKALAGQVARGDDPAAKKQEARRHESSNLRTLLAEGGPYQRELGRRRIVAAKVIMSGLNRGLHRLLSKDVADLTRREFVSAIDLIVAAGKPGAAGELRKYSHTFLEWCVSTGRAHHNVLAGLRRPKRSRAERLAAASNGGTALTDDQIRKLWQTAGGFGSFGSLVRLALLTGARRGELAGLERSHILADRLVILPEHAKTGARHEIPLTPLMRSIIAGEPGTASPLIFRSAKTGGRLKGWTKLVARLQRASGVDFRLHDLRRTVRTLMTHYRVDHDVAELAIGHAREGLRRQYDFAELWDLRCNAFAKVSNHVAALIDQPTGKSATIERASEIYGEAAAAVRAVCDLH